MLIRNVATEANVNNFLNRLSLSVSAYPRFRSHVCLFFLPFSPQFFLFLFSPSRNKFLIKNPFIHLCPSTGKVSHRLKKNREESNGKRDSMGINVQGFEVNWNSIGLRVKIVPLFSSYSFSPSFSHSLFSFSVSFFSTNSYRTEIAPFCYTFWDRKISFHFIHISMQVKVRK